MPRKQGAEAVPEHSTQSFSELALKENVVRRALKVSLIVGSILAVINHAPSVFQGQFSIMSLLQVLMTYAVPYGVSTWSSVQTTRETSVQQA